MFEEGGRGRIVVEVLHDGRMVVVVVVVVCVRAACYVVLHVVFVSILCP